MALKKSKKKLIRLKKLRRKELHSRLGRLSFKMELFLLVIILIGLNFFIAPDDPAMQKIIAIFLCSIFALYCSIRLFVFMNCDD